MIYHLKEKKDELSSLFATVAITTYYDILKDEVMNGQITKKDKYYKKTYTAITDCIIAFFHVIDFRTIITEEIAEDKTLLLDHLEKMTATQFKTFFNIIMDKYATTEVNEDENYENETNAEN